MSPLLVPPTRLEGFPSFQLLPSQTLFRIHRATYGPWWFSSGTPQRFDLAPPLGTCYLAEEQVGAFVEAFQDWTGTIIPRDEVAVRHIATLSVATPMTLADCTAPRVLAFGITGEIHSNTDRAGTQAWAAAFSQAGFGGIRYLVRHDPAQRRIGVALFGAAGEAGRPVGSSSPITDDLLNEVARTFGISVR